MMPFTMKGEGESLAQEVTHSPEFLHPGSLGGFHLKSVLYTLFQTSGLLLPSVTCIRTKMCLTL